MTQLINMVTQRDTNYFYQWDTDQYIVLGPDLTMCDYVHFKNPNSNVAYRIKVQDGMARVPDELLQQEDAITAWAYTDVEHRTVISQIFYVVDRQKPSNYEFTPTDVEAYKILTERLQDVEDFVDALHTSSMMPSEADREKFKVLVLKEENGKLVGTNLPLADIMKNGGGDVTQADLEKLKEEQKAVDDTQDKKILALEQRPTGSPILLASTDTQVFTVDKDGVPVPQEQKAHIHIDKNNLEGDVVITGKDVPVNTLDFDVTPMDMVKSDELIFTGKVPLMSSSDWHEIRVTSTVNNNTKVCTMSETTGLSFIYADVNLPIETEVYTRAIIKNANSRDELCRYRVLYSGSYSSGSYESLNKGKTTTFSEITRVKDISNRIEIYAEDKKAGDVFEVSDVMIIPIGKLRKKYPQYTDEQLKAILDESLPYIPAQETRTLGGVVTLENLVVDSTNTEPWEANKGTLTKNPPFITYEAPDRANALGAAGLRRITKESPLDDKLFMRINSISGTDGYSIAIGKSLTSGANINYQIGFKTEPYRNNLIVGSGRFENPSVVTIDCSKGISVIDIESNLLDLQLSLMGYDTDEKKADWCNEHIPFFEGTYDLVLEIADEKTITATCADRQSSVVIKTMYNISDVSGLATREDVNALSARVVTIDQTVARHGADIKRIEGKIPIKMTSADIEAIINRRG